MRLLKRAYVGAVHSFAGLAPVADWGGQVTAGDPYAWQRWAASLLAIHNVDRMIALDVPWWNVAATRAVAEHLAACPGARVFEYGAGASTAWLARRAGDVISIEHDLDWHTRIAPLVGVFPNVALHRRELADGHYARAIEDVGGQFDLIVIDGRRRVDCLRHSLAHLKPGGMILFDDSGRRRYRDAIEGCGIREHRHFGRSYCVPYPDHSSILHA